MADEIVKLQEGLDRRASEPIDQFGTDHRIGLCKRRQLGVGRRQVRRLDRVLDCGLGDRRWSRRRRLGRRRRRHLRWHHGAVLPEIDGTADRQEHDRDNDCRCAIHQPPPIGSRLAPNPGWRRRHGQSSVASPPPGDPSGEPQADDRPPRPSPFDLLESRVVVHGLRAEPQGIGTGSPGACRLDTLPAAGPCDFLA